MTAPSTDVATATRSSTLLVFLGFLLLALIVLMAVNFQLVARQDRFDREYQEHVGELRVVSQRLSKNATEAVGGTTEAFRFLEDDRKEFDRRLGILNDGDTGTGLPPAAVGENLERVRKIWAGIRDGADVIIESWSTITGLNDISSQLGQTVPRLQTLADEVTDQMIKSEADQDQIKLAARQSLLLERAIRNVNVMLRGGPEAVTAADSFGRDTALFGRTLEGLLEGSPALGVDPVDDGAARGKLEEIRQLFADVRQNAGTILESSPELFRVRDAADTIFSSSDTLADSLTELDRALKTGTGNPLVSATTGFILLGLAVLVLLLLVGVYARDNRARLNASMEQNQRNQQAILRLLDEMGDLADGDLTVKATVTEDFTGAIADSVNYAVEQLRHLVSAINNTAVLVSGAAQETQATAAHLADASHQQAHQITETSQAIREMASSIEGVSANATESAGVATQAVEIANKGYQTVQNTIHGMDTIREQIQETSKRIKRLGESSQEIGNIVSLINDIAEQTNILALNAAIQAASAGEAGRGFAVVADEVQRLAERSGNATRQIEALVKTIQSDTNEAVISMEQSTAGVVKGARLAQDAGVALEEIDDVSKRLADLIQNISEAANRQSTSAAQVSRTMAAIQEVTHQTQDGVGKTADSVGKLAEMANTLRDSVADFKLPHEHEAMDG